MEMSESRLNALDLNQQASLLIKSGNIDAAKAKLDSAIEIDPMVMDSYKNYGDLCQWGRFSLTTYVSGDGSC